MEVMQIVFILHLGYIYFANHMTESSYIEVMKANGTNRTILYKTADERPYRLAVDPKNRYLLLGHFSAHKTSIPLCLAVFI